ncbi:unnamed protein product, partial [Prorocentrum cordatum]
MNRPSWPSPPPTRRSSGWPSAAPTRPSSRPSPPLPAWRGASSQAARPLRRPRTSTTWMAASGSRR